jgi:hypothetical protein
VTLTLFMYVRVLLFIVLSEYNHALYACASASITDLAHIFLVKKKEFGWNVCLYAQYNHVLYA